MGEITFLLNGARVCVRGEPATRTLLDWLRDQRRLTGTKEGCNEGDCGACTVMLSSLDGDTVSHRALNACILFLPQLDGKAVRTVEGVAAPDGRLHPVQQAMIDHHGSQCGYCTPGFIVAMATAHANGRTDHDDVLAGNLCRCTGYAPIVRAAQAAAAEPVPDWIAADADALRALARDRSLTGEGFVAPRTLDELAGWYADHPGVPLVAGATDLGLWVTKGLSELPELCFISGVDELRQVSVTPDAIRVGAAVTLNELRDVIAPFHRDFAELIRRYGSDQVRNAATIGGNIANGSPIGDGPPALIALGARLHLRRGGAVRDMALEDFFVAYGKQDRQPGELVEAVTIPRQPDRLKCYKLSKRFDQDISAVCGCLSITVDDGIVTGARIAFGGMAATPKRAAAVEAALTGKPWATDIVRAATDAFADDYQPIDDMRASASYRLQAARNMLARYFTEDQADPAATRVLEVGA